MREPRKHHSGIAANSAKLAKEIGTAQVRRELETIETFVLKLAEYAEGIELEHCSYLLKRLRRAIGDL